MEVLLSKQWRWENYMVHRMMGEEDTGPEADEMKIWLKASIPGRGKTFFSTHCLDQLWGLSKSCPVGW
jgi:hypothetical protein